MITRYFEPFTLLEATPHPDGFGGNSEAFSVVTAFSGVLSYTPGEVRTAADQLHVSHHPVLLHELDMTLAPGDYVRRDADGTLYRVTGRTADMRAPVFSGLQFAQVPVERVVYA